MKNLVHVNSNVITWAIRRAGFNISAFAEKHPAVVNWISGEKPPTVKQLEKFSKQVHVPYGYLFLSNPPQESLPLTYFRTSKSGSNKSSLELFDTATIIKNRQDWLSEYLWKNGYDEKSFVSSFTINEDFRLIADDIRAKLILEKDWASKFSSRGAALDEFTSAIENLGIFVNFNGIVGSNTKRKLDVSEFRGFVLVDKIAPFLFINSADSKAGQIFTLAHELAHIWLGQSAGFDLEDFNPANDDIEIHCNKIAAELLVPLSVFMNLWQGYDSIKKLSGLFKVSEIVIARVALQNGMISAAEFTIFYSNFLEELSNAKQSKRSGGNYYASSKKRLGLPFAFHIYQAVKGGVLPYRDAFRMTGMKGSSFDKFFDKYFG